MANNQMKVPAIIDVTVVEEQSLKLTVKEINLKNEAQKLGGVVVEENEGPEGVDLVLKFTDARLMQVWMNFMGIQQDQQQEGTGC